MRCSPKDSVLHLHAIRPMIEGDVDRELHARGQSSRSGGDDRVFATFNTSLAIGLGHGLEQFYIELGRDIDKRVRTFEIARATEVHKGSLYFNTAVCALVAHDFDTALYYFAAAGEEDRKTSGHAVAAMFLTNPLFKAWVTDKLHRMLAAETARVPATTNLLLPSPYVEGDIDAFLATLPIGVLGSVIVTLCRYLASRVFDQANPGTSIIPYQLVVDLCVAYEVTLKTWVRNKGASPKGTLGAALRTNLAATAFGDISTYAGATFPPKGTMWPCRNLADYDALLNGGILTSIDSETDRLKKAAQLICFVTHTRNQVAHDLDSNAALYKNDQLCQDVARRVLVALCMTAYL